MITYTIVKYKTFDINEGYSNLLTSAYGAHLNQYHGNSHPTPSSSTQGRILRNWRRWKSHKWRPNKFSTAIYNLIIIQIYIAICHKHVMNTSHFGHKYVAIWLCPYVISQHHSDITRIRHRYASLQARGDVEFFPGIPIEYCSFLTSIYLRICIIL